MDHTGPTLIQIARGCVSLCLYLLLGTAAHAQWGVRLILPQLENVTKVKAIDYYYMGLGMDFDLTERSSFGVDVFLDMDWSFPDGHQRYAEPFGTYYERTRVYGAQYRAQYHFADNSKGAMYLGSTFGLRYIRQTIAEDPVNTISSSYQGYFEQANGVVVPVGLRLGFRGGLEDGYGDVYVGVNYAIGGDRALSDAPFLVEDSELSGIIFQIGFAAGFGN